MGTDVDRIQGTAKESVNVERAERTIPAASAFRPIGPAATDKFPFNMIDFPSAHLETYAQRHITTVTERLDGVLVVQNDDKVGDFPSNLSTKSNASGSDG